MAKKNERLLTDAVKAFTNRVADRAAKVPSVGISVCPEVLNNVNQLLTRACALKKNQIFSERQCMSVTSKTQPVDLVVLIDTSGSMADEANDLSASADEAITKAMNSCPSDLRVKWFGIGIKGVGKFTESHHDYLLGVGVSAGDLNAVAGNQEEGGPAIVDICDYFDWRPNASRAIFFLGDEPLKEGLPYTDDDAKWCQNAIDAGKVKGVKVFTYAGTPNPGDPDSKFINDYQKVATETQGVFFQAPASNLGGFTNILEKIICVSQTQGCRPVDLPNIQPCFRIKWGDGKKDQIETEDTEILCITALNPYSNITIKNLSILILQTTDSNNNAVPLLPDGTPSVIIKPQYAVHFGDIPPCNVNTPDTLPSVSREVVLMTNGAKEGKYNLYIMYCYSIEFTLAAIDTFKLKLITS